MQNTAGIRLRPDTQQLGGSPLTSFSHRQTQHPDSAGLHGQIPGLLLPTLYSSGVTISPAEAGPLSSKKLPVQFVTVCWQETCPSTSWEALLPSAPKA